MPEGPQREQLLEMARTWENLAAERTELISRHPELAIAGEMDEDGKSSRAAPKKSIK
jgi:hypothetical protein